MPKAARNGLTQQQLNLIARYELHKDLVRDIGLVAEMDMDVWISQLGTEDCAFLLHYFGVKHTVIHREREALPHEHTRRTH